MKTVPLYGAKAAGRVALVDDEDYPLASQYRWRIWEMKVPGRRDNGPYAIAHIYRNGRRTTIFMHCLIMGQAGIDHHDCYGLNNQRSNLRTADPNMSSANRRPHLSRASRFKGLSFEHRRNKWRARIRINGKLSSLGSFAVEEDAARAYDEAARKAWGEYARFNFPFPGEQSALISESVN